MLELQINDLQILNAPVAEVGLAILPTLSVAFLIESLPAAQIVNRGMQVLLFL